MELFVLQHWVFIPYVTHSASPQQKASIIVTFAPILLTFFTELFYSCTVPLLKFEPLVFDQSKH